MLNALISRCCLALRTSCLLIPAGTRTLPQCGSTSTGISMCLSPTQLQGNCPSAATQVNGWYLTVNTTQTHQNKVKHQVSTHQHILYCTLGIMYNLTWLKLFTWDFRIPGVSGWLLPPGQWSDDDADHQQCLQLVPFWPHHPRESACMATGPTGSQLSQQRRGVGQNFLQVQFR